MRILLPWKPSALDSLQRFASGSRCEWANRTIRHDVYIHAMLYIYTYRRTWRTAYIYIYIYMPYVMLYIYTYRQRRRIHRKCGAWSGSPQLIMLQKSQKKKKYLRQIAANSGYHSTIGNIWLPQQQHSPVCELSSVAAGFTNGSLSSVSAEGLLLQSTWERER